MGGIKPASIIAICLAKLDSENASPCLGPVCINISVIITAIPKAKKYRNIKFV
jgi:hypothetical protein